MKRGHDNPVGISSVLLRLCHVFRGVLTVIEHTTVPIAAHQALTGSYRHTTRTRPE